MSAPSCSFWTPGRSCVEVRVQCQPERAGDPGPHLGGARRRVTPPGVRGIPAINPGGLHDVRE